MREEFRLMEVKLIREDRRKCGCYMDVKNCLLATALKRLYPDSSILAGGDHFILGGVQYNIEGWKRALIALFSDLPAFLFIPFTIKATIEED